MKKTFLTLLTLTMLMAVPLQMRAADIPINSTTFPDENFRNWVLTQGYGQDGVLTETEIAGVSIINVSSKNIATLKGIEYFTALTWLDCSTNQLTALDVSKNTALTTLVCVGNQLTALDVSNNTALTGLSCSDNQLTALNVSQNTALTSLYCYNNQLTALDVSKNTALTGLTCDNNQLTALDVSKNTALTMLFCSYNQLTALDVSKNTALTLLSCFNNQINETEMGNLVESLPTNDGMLLVKYLNDANEQNVITTAQVATVKAKGWKVLAFSDDKWVEYDGDASGDAEGIDVIGNSQPEDTPVYNLNGQRVSTPGKGIYIKNGRKVLMK